MSEMLISVCPTTAIVCPFHRARQECCRSWQIHPAHEVVPGLVRGEVRPGHARPGPGAEIFRALGSPAPCRKSPAEPKSRSIRETGLVVHQITVELGVEGAFDPGRTPAEEDLGTAAGESVHSQALRFQPRRDLASRCRSCQSARHTAPESAICDSLKSAGSAVPPAIFPDQPVGRAPA